MNNIFYMAASTTALLTTLTGSIMPAFTMSTYSPAPHMNGTLIDVWIQHSVSPAFNLYQKLSDVVIRIT